MPQALLTFWLFAVFAEQTFVVSSTLYASQLYYHFEQQQIIRFPLDRYT
jgi:hypothetical protein